MSRGCIRFPDCIPCAPQTQVVEKAEIEKVAGDLYSEGRISQTEMREVVISDRKYRHEVDEVPEDTVMDTIPQISNKKSPQVGKKKKRIDNRSSILPSITVDHRHAKQMISESSPHIENKDPITLEPISENDKNVFVFSLGLNKTVRYNVSSLVSYMVSTGDFNEPTSRLPFSEEQLDQLDKIAASMKCGLPSVKEARLSRASEYIANKEQRDLLEGVERCLGEVIVSMIDVVTAANSSDALRLVSKYHDFDHYLTQLVSIDAVMALTCLKQYRELSLGPKNKRRKDDYGLLKVLLGYLDEKIVEVKAKVDRSSA